MDTTNTLNKIKDLCALLSQNVYYDEAKAMNVRADGIKVVKVIDDNIFAEQAFIYIEEFTKGKYTVKPFFNKTTRMNVYFSMLIDEAMESAEFRECVRAKIEQDLVRHFMEFYNESEYFFPITEWSFQTALPHFDTHEVSIMLEFDCKERAKCL